MEEDVLEVKDDEGNPTATRRKDQAKVTWLSKFLDFEPLIETIDRSKISRLGQIKREGFRRAAKIRTNSKEDRDALVKKKPKLKNAPSSVGHT